MIYYILYLILFVFATLDCIRDEREFYEWLEREYPYVE